MNILEHVIATRRPPLGFLLVVALHVLFVYGLLSGIPLGHSIESTSPLVVVPPIDDPPPLPAPKQADPVSRPVGVPDPAPPKPVDFDDETPARPDPGRSLFSQRPSGEKSAGIEGQVHARPDPRNPLSQPPYPPASIRNSEEGALTLSLRVGADGRVSEAVVLRTSGYERLDRAAVEEAKRHWRLLPAMRADAPIEEWMSLRVVFRLDQR